MDGNLCMGGMGEVVVEGLEVGITDRYSHKKTCIHSRDEVIYAYCLITTCSHCQ